MKDESLYIFMITVFQKRNQSYRILITWVFYLGPIYGLSWKTNPQVERKFIISFQSLLLVSRLVMVWAFSNKPPLFTSISLPENNMYFRCISSGGVNNSTWWSDVGHLKVGLMPCCNILTCFLDIKHFWVVVIIIIVGLYFSIYDNSFVLKK